MNLFWTFTLLLALSVSTFAQDISAQLVYAFNGPVSQSKEVSELGYEDKLQRAFKYHHYRVTHQGVSSLKSDGVQSFALGSDFSAQIEKLSKNGDKYAVKVILYHFDKEILSTNADFSKGNPLFIKGPAYDQGLLIFVFTVK
ncbi:MAG: hypothetical protein SGI71_07950 [Verrucomicrobiota bacterium]|nr:hypothetical protein [Verrucomicrobiota bacterium]